MDDNGIERLCRRKRLKVPMNPSKKGRLWLTRSRDIAVQCPAAQWMDHAFVYALSIAITSGRLTSCIIARTMAEFSEH